MPSYWRCQLAFRQHQKALAPTGTVVDAVQGDNLLLRQICDKEESRRASKMAKPTINTNCLLDDAANLVLEDLKFLADIKAVAVVADSPRVAVKIYLISRANMAMDNDQERGYRDQLVKEQGIAPDLVFQLENQTFLKNRTVILSYKPWVLIDSHDFPTTGQNEI